MFVSLRSCGNFLNFTCFFRDSERVELNATVKFFVITFKVNDFDLIISFSVSDI